MIWMKKFFIHIIFFLEIHLNANININISGVHYQSVGKENSYEFGKYEIMELQKRY